VSLAVFRERQLWVESGHSPLTLRANGTSYFGLIMRLEGVNETKGDSLFHKKRPRGPGLRGHQGVVVERE